MNATIYLSAALCAVAGHALAQSCQSQGALDAYATSIMQTVQSDGDPECGMNGNGNCVPVTMQPGDVLPGDGQSVTDKFGNTWSLQINQGRESGAGNWYGNVVYNGQLLGGNDHNGGLSYAAAIRLGSDGLVYIERSKGAGWQVEPGDPSAQQNYNYNTWQYVTPPNGTGCGASATSAQANAAASLAGAPSSAPISGSPTGSPSCNVPSGAITPGNGSVTDASGNVFTVDATTNDQVMINGQAATPNGEGSQTSAAIEINGQIYGQDENSLQWFALVQDPSRPYWQPVDALPLSSGSDAQSAAGSPPSALPGTNGAAQADTGGLNAMLQQIAAQCQDALQRLSAAQAELATLSQRK